MGKLYDVIDLLAEGQRLDKKYKDHALLGKYIGARECHIESDWILIYYLMDEDLVLRLSRTGTHSKLLFFC